jgi:hypothetical protein
MKECDVQLGMWHGGNVKVGLEQVFTDMQKRTVLVNVLYGVSLQ